MVYRRDRSEPGVGTSGNAPVAFQVAVRPGGVDSAPSLPTHQARRVGHPVDGYGTPIHRRLQGDTGKRGITPIPFAHDAYLGSIGDPLLHQVAHSIGEVRLHFPTPLTKTGPPKLLIEIGPPIL